MANTRLSISTDPAILRAIKVHAEAAGLDVSAYMIAAAIAQMAADDAVSAVFSPLDAENTSALAETAETSPAPLPSFEDLTAEEQHLVLRVMRSAGTDGAAGSGTASPSGTHPRPHGPP